MRKAMCLLVLVACGGGSGGTMIDAARGDAPGDVRTDAPGDGLTDAAADAPADAMFDAGPIAMTHHKYVVDSQQVPANNNQARDMGFDLDNNATIDNQFGMVLGTLYSMGFDLQAATTASIDKGQSITLLDVAADSFTTEPHAAVTTAVGSNPMPAACASANDMVCRHHLQGTGSFTAAPAADPMTGTIANGTLAVGPGTARVPFSMFANSAPISIDLIGARVQISAATATSLGQVKIGGAISQSDINTKIYPRMRDGFQAIVVRDCTQLASPPTCGCASNSTGATLLSLFEVTHDCTITLTEIQSNSLIQSLFAPDVTINGVMGLSYGYTGTAVKATF